MGVCTGTKLLKTKIQKEIRDHFFFLFVSSSISHSKSVANAVASSYQTIANLLKLQE
jgi:hypothetical protein